MIDDAWLDVIEDVRDLGPYRDGPKRADLICPKCDTRVGNITADGHVVVWHPDTRTGRVFTVYVAAIDDLDDDGVTTHCAGRRCRERGAALTVERAALVGARHGGRVPAVIRTRAEAEQILADARAASDARVLAAWRRRIESVPEAERARFVADIVEALDDPVVVAEVLRVRLDEALGKPEGPVARRWRQQLIATTMRHA